MWEQLSHIQADSRFNTSIQYIMADYYFAFITGQNSDTLFILTETAFLLFPSHSPRDADKYTGESKLGVMAQRQPASSTWSWG